MCAVCVWCVYMCIVSMVHVCGCSICRFGVCMYVWIVYVCGMCVACVEWCICLCGECSYLVYGVSVSACVVCVCVLHM